MKRNDGTIELDDWRMHQKRKPALVCVVRLGAGLGVRMRWALRVCLEGFDLSAH